MADVQIHRDDVTLDEPILVEGLPGVGLVGKIAADHLVNTHDMVHLGSLHCDGLPEVAVYQADETDILPPVRLYADPEADLVVLTSDVPVSPNSAEEFASCVTGWVEANDVTPVYLSGLPTEKDDVPELTGVATGSAAGLLEEIDVDPPSDNGAITGPTGALVYEAQRRDIDALGLVVESDAKFPDPEAARVLLVHGIGPLAGIEVDTESLVDQAEEVSQAKNQLAQQLDQESDESTSARPLGFQ